MSLRVWLPLNRDLRNNGSESVTVTNSGATFSDGCANFDGSSNYISCGNPNIDGGNISAACWVYMISSSNATNYLISLNNSSGFVDHEIALATGSDKKIYFVAGGNSSLTYESISLNTWTHLAVTFDGSKITGYVNGVNIGSISHSTKLDKTLLTIGARHNGSNTYAYFSNCKMYDFRIYDHALSKKEVAELARGCVLHYPMNDTLNESTVNLSSTPSNNGSATSAYAWDQTKHADAIKPGGSWSVGYNSGVAEPTIGYHAYWKMMDGVPTMVFTDMNSDIGYPHRWIGISDYSQLLKTIGSNTTYTVSFEAKADRENMYVHGGLYYKRTADEGYGFRDGSSYTKLSTNWQRYSYTKTTQTVYDVNSIYIYGIQDGNTQRLEGICYVRNFQVEIKDHATPYTPTGRNENLNTANWGAYSSYWSIESQTLTEIKLVSKRATGNTVALANYVLLPKLKANDIITISGYLYKGDTIFKTSQSTLTTYTSSYQTLSFASYDNGYFESIIKVLVNNPEQWIFHSPLFGQTSIGDICYIRNLDIHITPYLKDVSGFDNHSLITGSLPLVTTPKSPRYDKCMNIDNSGTNRNGASCTLNVPQLKSASFWVYIESSIPTSSMIVFQDKPSHLAFGFYQGTNVILYAGPSAKTCRYYITNNLDPNYNVKYNSWNHFCISQLEDYTTELWLNGVKQPNPTNEWWGENYEGFNIGARFHQGGLTGLFTGKLSDFRLFSHVLTQADVDKLYSVPIAIDDTNKLFCYEVDENGVNILNGTYYSLLRKVFNNGLSSYTQTNCQCTLTDEGYRIYRPANQLPASEGGTNNMWGGFVLDNSNNWMNLQKGHTYVIQFNIKGKTSNGIEISWSNLVGWAGGGLTPLPSNVTIINPITSNYNNTTDWKTFTYKFTINDDVYKVCTSSYSSFVEGETYISYKGFKYGFAYTNTGELGTDLYINNIRMYDITNSENTKANSNGIFSSLGVIENNTPHAKISNVGTSEFKGINEI